MTLFDDLKARYGNATITMLAPNEIEVYFNQATESIYIIQETIPNRFTVSYPELKKHGHKNKKYNKTISTSTNLVIEGVYWILDQVKQHGKVLPEFMD